MVVRDFKLSKFMPKLTLFDNTDEKIRDRKLKFIEILLIVGGILGGLRIEKDDSMNAVLGVFLVGSLLYYFTVSDLPKNSMLIIISAIFIAPSFAAIAILPFINPGISVIYGRMIYVLWVVLSLLVGAVLILSPSTNGKH